MTERRRPYRLPLDLSFAYSARRLVREHFGVSNASQAFDLDFEQIDLIHASGFLQSLPLKGAVSTDSEGDLIGEVIPGVPETFDRMLTLTDRIHASERLAVGEVSVDSIASSTGHGFPLDRNAALAREYCMAGADVIKLIDDALYGADPALWRGHMKTKIRGIVEAVRGVQKGRSSILYYCEADMSGIIEDLIEIGIDMIGPMSPKTTPINGDTRGYLDRIGLWGGVESEHLTGKGSAASIEAGVKSLAEMAQNGSSIVVAPDRLLGCDVSWERVRSLVRIVQSMRL